MAIDFTHIIKAFEHSKKTLPVAIGNMAKNHFRQSFRNEGFTDEALEKWQARKYLSKADKNFIKKSTGLSHTTLKNMGIDTAGGGRRILVRTGALRESIGVGVARFDMIEIGTYGITYGHYHNTGDTRDGVKRQFMGKSAVLSAQISNRIKKEMGEFLALK